MTRVLGSAFFFLAFLLSTPVRAEPLSGLVVDGELLFRELGYGDAQGVQVGVGGPLWREYWSFYGKLDYGKGDYDCCGLDLTVYDLIGSASHSLNHYFDRIDEKLVTLYGKAFFAYGSVDVENIYDDTFVGGGLAVGAKKLFVSDKLALTAEVGVARGRSDSTGTATSTGAVGWLTVNYKVLGPFSVRSMIEHSPGDDTITAGVRVEL